MDKKKIIRIICAAAGGLTVAVVAAVSAYMIWEKAPELDSAPSTLAEKLPSTPGSVTSSPEVEEQIKGIAFDTSRRDGVYTILLVGNDDGNGNTDTIMVGKIDTVRHSMNFVSIPRDTLINVDWPVRKLNSVYWGAVNNGGSGIDALLEHVKKLVGFDIDCYAVIDLEAFVKAVDTIGGVYFEVPEPIFYEDYWQGLYLDVDAGYQLLDGYQSMCLCRYRSGYITGDIGRIEMQHKFLKAAAEQFVDLGNIPNLSELVSILTESMDSNLTAANIAYFIRQALMCQSEDINFYTAPNTPAMAQSYSYAFLDLYDWMKLVNSSLNPYDSPVTEGNLDLVYILNGEVHCTAVLKGTWYFDFGKSQNKKPPMEVQEPEPPEEPAEEEIVIEEEPPAEDEPLMPSNTPSPSEPPNNDNWLEYD